MIKLSSLDIKSWAPSVFISLGILIGVLNAINPSPLKLIVCLLFAGVSLATSHINWNDNNKRQIISLIVVVFIAWVFNVISVFAQSGENPLRLVTLLYMLYAILVSFVLLNKRVSLIPLKITFYLTAFYFYYQCVILEVLADELFMFSAGGMMASILFSISIPIQLLDYRNNGRVSIIPPIVVFIVSIYSISRTALICSILFLLINLLVISFGNKKLRILGLLFLVIVVFVSYKWILQSLDDISALEIYNKFEYMGMDSSSREDIWKVYFNDLDLGTFFLGRNVDKTHLILGFANTHNSFIQLHSQIGILSFIFIFYFIKSCIYYIRKDIYVFGLLLVLVLRCSFDTLFFFNIYDFAIIIFMLNYREYGMINRDTIKVSLV